MPKAYIGLGCPAPLAGRELLVDHAEIQSGLVQLPDLLREPRHGLVARADDWRWQWFRRATDEANEREGQKYQRDASRHTFCTAYEFHFSYPMIYRCRHRLQLKNARERILFFWHFSRKPLHHGAD